MAAVRSPDAGSAALLHDARVQARGALTGNFAPALGDAPVPQLPGVDIPKGAHAPPLEIDPQASALISSPIDQRANAAITQMENGQFQPLAPVPMLPSLAGLAGAPALPALPDNGPGLTAAPPGENVVGGTDSGPPVSAAPPAVEFPGLKRLKAIAAKKAAAKSGFWSAAGHEFLGTAENEARAFLPALGDLGTAISDGMATVPGGAPLPSSAALGQRPITVTPQGENTADQWLKQKAITQEQLAAKSPGVTGFAGRLAGGLVPFVGSPEAYSGASLLNAYHDARQRGDSRLVSSLQGVLEGGLNEVLARFGGGSGKLAQRLLPRLLSNPTIARVAQQAAAASGAQISVEELRRLILQAAGDKNGAAALRPFDTQTLATLFLMPFALEGVHAGLEHAGRMIPAPIRTGLGALSPDHPTVEPQADLLAQFQDLDDPRTPRSGVLIANGQKLSKGLTWRVRAARAQGRVVSLPQGDLVLRTAADADKARAGLEAGLDAQQVLGWATGAGTGKTPERTLVVQGQTPSGAVATEGLVSPQELSGRVAQVVAEGKAPVITTPQAAIERRAAQVEGERAESEEPPPGLGMASLGGQQVPVQIEGNAGGGQIQVRVLNAEGDPGDVIAIPSDALLGTSSAAGPRPTAEPPLDPLGHGPWNAAAEMEGKQPAYEARKTAEGFKVGEIYRVPRSGTPHSETHGGERVRIISIHRYGDGEWLGRGRFESGGQATFTLPSELEHEEPVEKLQTRRAAQRNAGMPAPDATRDSALKYLAKLGGVSLDEAESEGLDPADMKDHRAGIRRAFHNGSRAMSIESAGEALAEDGWPVTDANGAVDKDRVLAVLEDELHGRPRYSTRRDLERFAQDQEQDRALRAEYERDAAEHVPGYASQEESVRDFTALADRARRIDPDATERALEVDDDAEAERRLREIIDNGIEARAEADVEGRVAPSADAGERKPAAAGRGSIKKEGAADLFGEDTRTAQAIADEIRRRDAARNSGQESVETGRPDDLFSQARHQIDLTDELRTQQSPGTYANRLLGDLARHADATGFTERARRPSDAGRAASLHSLLDEIGQHATGPVRRIVAAIRAHVIETPVRFVQELEPPPGKSVSAGTAGLHIAEIGRHEIQIKLDHPGAHPVRVLLHEAVHAATSGALRLEPEGEFAKELERLLQIARERTDRMAGRKLTAADYRGKLYGLRNLREFLAEALSNPDFQAHLLASDQHVGPCDRLVRLMSKIGEAIRTLLGVRGYSEARLLDNVLHQSLGLIRSQGRLNERLGRIFEPAEQPAPIVHSGTMSDAEQFQALADALEDEPERIHGEDGLLARTPAPIRDIVRQQLRLARRVTRGSVADWMRKGIRGWATEDQLLQRAMRHFGSVDDSFNPIRRYMKARAEHNALRTRAIEPSRAVASRWARLNKADNHQLGELMRDSTIWKIDPSKPDTKQLKTMQRRRDFQQRYTALRQRYEQLSDEQRGIYQDVLRDNARIARVARRAAVDSVLDSVAVSVTPAQRSLLYAMTDPRQLDGLIGPGLAVDVGEYNDLVRSSIRRLSPLVEGEFPYFHLGRVGTKVVSIRHEGDREFATQEAAEQFAERVRELGPDARAKVLRNLDRWQVIYNDARYAAFHGTAAAAEEDAERLRAQGFDVAPVTEKTVGSPTNDLGAAGRLIGEARRRIRKFGASSPADSAAAEGLERILASTWNEMMAERAEHIGATMHRRGVAGIEGAELRSAYARHVLSVASHVATLRTIFDEADALGRIREAARDAQIGNAMQATMYARGYLFHELAQRIQQRAEAHQAGSVQEFISQLVAANYLISPAHAAIWAVQPATIGLPTLSSRFGLWRSGQALTKAMRWAANPAIRGLMRNLTARPEGFTDSDIAETLAAAAAHEPTLARFLPQIRELGARGVFTHGYTSMLTDMGRGPRGKVRGAMQVGWALPQLGDTFSRITTALAGLHLTGGDVDKTADLVHETMLNYDAANRPRHFKTLDRGGLRFVTSLQSYVQGIMHLLATHAYDAITGAGRPRSEALKALAGMALMSSVLAGLGGTTAGPVSWLANGIHHAIFPNDPYNFRTALHDWLADHMGQTAADLAYYGVPYALGVNLSHRIGIGDLFRSFDDLVQATNWEQTMGALGQILLGPLCSGIEQHWKAFNRYRAGGDWGDALASLMPLKVWDDTLKSINLARRGYQGNTASLPPLGADAAVTQGLGFQPSGVAKVQSKAEALYTLNQQRYARKAELLREWLAAHDKTPSIGQIMRFNQENPGVAITYADFLRAVRQRARAARIGSGRSGRDPTVNRLFDY